MCVWKKSLVSPIHTAALERQAFYIHSNESEPRRQSTAIRLASYHLPASLLPTFA